MKKFFIFYCAVFSFSLFAAVEFNEIRIKYRTSPPFFFRFPPPLKHIKGPVIMAKVGYKHDTLGNCIFEMVKSVRSGEFFGWAKSKKIKGYPAIYCIDPKSPEAPIGKHAIEVAFNQFSMAMVEKINQKELEKQKK